MKDLIERLGIASRHAPADVEFAIQRSPSEHDCFETKWTVVLRSPTTGYCCWFAETHYEGVAKFMLAALNADDLIAQWRANASMLAEGNKSELPDPSVGMQRACADQLEALLCERPVPA